MQIFLDTANLDEIKKYNDWGIVDGVTTNPTLIAKEGVSLEKRIKDICKVVNGPISCEVIAVDAEGMIKEGMKYAKWHKNIYVKVPMTTEGLKAVKALTKKKIRTNVTLVFSLTQALLAAKAGATIVSPFVGRLDDIGEKGMILIGDIMDGFMNYEYDTKVLVASVRNLGHINEAIKLGADICTIPPKLLDEMVHHELTDKGLKKFLDDWKSLKQK